MQHGDALFQLTEFGKQGVVLFLEPARALQLNAKSAYLFLQLVVLLFEQRGLLVQLFNAHKLGFQMLEMLLPELDLAVPL